ncbi:MAG: ABC transporter ATP-binding protein [Candidatus Micrarchaeota archaeon]|nr:ABC transporter ATP-binding protein [Candidatus Micrarchaeota archaeon]
MRARKGALMQLIGVSKIYQMGEEKVYALRDVNMEIHEGEFTAILGPSGSGKSTLLNMLGLLDTPTTGKIILDGIDTTALSQKELAAVRGKKIGFIFQMFNLIPSLTVLQNVAMPAIIANQPKEKAFEKASAILEEIGMGNRLLHYPNQLSGGQRQRVAIARALINDPDIILADEPTGNLDSRTGHEVLRRFKELHDKGKTILIVTHDLEVAKITKRTIHVADGKVSR